MKRIVLVEDDEAIRDSLIMAFRTSGYEIIELEHGARIVNGEIIPPDLFMVDKNISGMDGLELCRFIKGSEQYRNVPVLMLSANPDILQLAITVGADDALEKPFLLKKLREKIAHLLNQ